LTKESARVTAAALDALGRTEEAKALRRKKKCPAEAGQGSVMRGVEGHAITAVLGRTYSLCQLRANACIAASRVAGRSAPLFANKLLSCAIEIAS
jgi:hypothetical protein